MRQALLPALGEVFRGVRLAERKEVAANVLADYAVDQPDLLVDLLLDADPRQYAVLSPVLERHREQAVARLLRELAALPDYWKNRPLEAAWKEPPPGPRRMPTPSTTAQLSAPSSSRRSSK